MIHKLNIGLIIFSIALIACAPIDTSKNGPSDMLTQSINNDDSVFQPDTSKPIITTSFSQSTYPQLFEAAFFKGTKAIQFDLEYSFSVYELGNINCESGKLIACDPVTMYDAEPFTQTFPIGLFPVELAMATTENDERVAFARIIFSKEDVTKWEYALIPGQKPISLKDSTIYCYGVDAGTGLFIDEVANSNYNDNYFDVFVKKMEDAQFKGFIHEFNGHNFATFSTGYGDGCYATFIGFDKDGNVCRLVTDFGLVEWWRLD